MAQVTRDPSLTPLPPVIQSALAPLMGRPCCRQRVGRGRSLSLGFGKRIMHSKTKLIDPYYGEWEIGTYSSAWRIVCGGIVVFGSSETVDSMTELDAFLQKFKFGSILSIELVSPFDVCVRLEADTQINFLCASSDEDAILHVFGPESLYVEYSQLTSWKLGKSDEPWG